MIMDGLTQQHYSIEVPLHGSLQHVLDKFDKVLDYLQRILQTFRESTSVENALCDRYETQARSSTGMYLLNDIEALRQQTWYLHQSRINRNFQASPDSAQQRLRDCIYYICSEIRNEISQMDPDADEEDVERACAVYKRAEVIREKAWF